MLKKAFVCLLCGICVLSCGVDDYVYLAPVDNVYAVSDSNASIIIPDNSSNSYFRYYEIFYRIYISDQSATSITTSNQRYNINQALSSHYSTLDPYTSNDNVTPSSIGTVFGSLKYYSLYVDTGQVIPVSQRLSTVVSGDVVDIIFMNTGPFLRVNNAAPELPLRRSGDGFTAVPDQTFFNTTIGGTAITDEANIGIGRNNDVEPKPAMAAGTPRYTYVSMYIAAAGVDSNFTAVYSRPKHIGIFRLPNP